MVKGRIHSFESFSALDGPGIRFVVFMQGCPLRCIYCHNRDTRNAWGGKEYSVEELMREVEKYIDFIKLSGGGITFTGGEPTLQHEFVAEVFKECKEIGIHTALDTCAFVDVEKVKGLLEFTDLVLLDIKHAIDEKHREITGVGNEKIKAFARYLSENGIPVWIRYVLIPGYTDLENDLYAAADFIKQLDNVKKIEVLPYHNLGEYKWEKLGDNYRLKGTQSPTPEQIEKANDILQSAIKPNVVK
ncbi:MAG: pyruvate formate-lyase-activating protein [Acetivibrionales bacterium]|jgi:pyruvate formate lyase activating enzyme